MKQLVLILICCLSFGFATSQNNGLNVDLMKPNPEKEKKFLPYLAVRYGGIENIETWKKNNRLLYFKELWYYCESFYVLRNYSTEGITLDEGAIDITRFESNRKENEEAIVVLPGFKDVLVLLPNNKLIYKP